MSLRRAFWDAGGRADFLKAEEVSYADGAVFIPLMVTLLQPGRLGAEERGRRVGCRWGGRGVLTLWLSPEQNFGGHQLKNCTGCFSSDMRSSSSFFTSVLILFVYWRVMYNLMLRHLSLWGSCTLGWCVWNVKKRSKWDLCVCSSSQVSSPRLWWTGSCDGEVRLPPQRFWLPSGCKEAEGQLRQRLAVCLEIWQDRRHDLSDPRLRRLGTRQWELPDSSEVGSPI